MIEDIFTFPGQRSAIENLALAVLLQAAIDLSTPSVCPDALEWFLSDEYRAYAKTFGIDPDLFLRQLFCRRYANWKRWTRTVQTFQLCQGEKLLAMGAWIKSRNLAILCSRDELYSGRSLDDVTTRFENCEIEWTSEGRA